ncbi:MAG: T9SS type A sorting domain-containing protein, partial [bacterium]|nr:T9SS type A sorting domain-containing protein [bacterium]
KIFNIYGKLIIELSNSDKWSGRDKDNNLLPSGVYLYQVHENNKYYTARSLSRDKEIIAEGIDENFFYYGFIFIILKPYTA